MNEDLAERLLAKVMNWTPEEDERERPKLADMAYYKYNHYQQFSPGMRFIESLALWLYQFDSDAERRIAYEFVRKHLVFISQSEMAHLVGMVFPDIVLPILLDEVAHRTGISPYRIKALAEHKDYRVVKRQSLFLGLSDGARIDMFRRSSPELSNEQVWLTYDPSSEKAKSLQGALRKDLKIILGRYPSDDECKFHQVFLLDDFSASGISYLRQEAGEFKGKLARTIGGAKDLQSLISESARIYVVLYIATSKAKQHIESMIKNWHNTSSCRYSWEIKVIQELPSDIQVASGCGELEDLLKIYTDEDIIDEHFLKGKHSKPYLGFDECGLPVVLYHNTPNNSLPILWQEEGRKHIGLFPRMSRHGREL